MNFKEIVKKHVGLEKWTRLVTYAAYLEKQNEHMNLTGFSDDRLWKEGIYESIVALENQNITNNMLDIGAGAGFPSIPFIICYPNIELTIVESNKKRINFLMAIKKILNLKVTFINQRIEDLSDENKFDFITARAVAPLKVLMEISHKVAKINAKFLWIKGPLVHQELSQSRSIMKKLKINDLQIHSINDLKLDKKINLVTYTKQVATPPGIPRHWAKIIKK